jgi:DNA-binding PadR family transcriptional regulator
VADMNISAHGKLRPLTPQVLHILVALSFGCASGYTLIRQVHQESGGLINLSKGSVYRTLQAQTARLLIRECPEHRSRCELTTIGRQVLAEELQYYAGFLTLAAARNGHAGQAAELGQLGEDDPIPFANFG